MAEDNKVVSNFSGVLTFNQSSSHFTPASESRYEKHKLNNDVDVKDRDEFIRNGANNFFPFEMEDIVKKTTLQKQASRTISSIANGPVFWQGLDGEILSDDIVKRNNEIYRRLNLTPNKLLGYFAHSNYLQGGSFVTLEFASNGFGFELARICNRKYKTGRLSPPIFKNGEEFHKDHFYHKDWGYHYSRRNKKVTASKYNTISWLEYNKDIEANKNKVVYVPTFDTELSLSDEVNRMQSYLIKEKFSLSDYYPLPPWFSATTYNYQKSEFLLSCFDVDDIQNGFHASGIVKLFHKDYHNPASSDAVSTFETQKNQVLDQLLQAHNSGSVYIAPYTTDPEGNEIPTEGTIKFEKFEKDVDKDRHLNFDKRIMNKVLTANGIIMPELVGIRDEKSTLSESGDKLINGVKLLNRFTIKPQIEMVEEFLNEVVNPLLGIEQRARIKPDLRTFLNLDKDLYKHFLHPEQFYDLYADLGLDRPTLEQIDSQLIPAYRNGNM